MQNQFHAELGVRFDSLDGATRKWSRRYYEQDLRAPWRAIFESVLRHWAALYPDASGESDVLAHLTARVLQEAATKIGSDRKALEAIGAVVDGSLTPESDDVRTLERMRRKIGDEALAAITATLREAMRGERPQPIVMPRGH